MTLQKLTLETISNLDGGRIGIAFANEIEALIRDLEERPTVDKPRKLEIVLELNPKEYGGDLEEVIASVTFKTKSPERVSGSVSMGVKKIGDRKSLIFDDLSLNNVDQMTLDLQDDADDPDAYQG